MALSAEELRKMTKITKEEYQEYLNKYNNLTKELKQMKINKYILIGDK